MKNYKNILFALHSLILLAFTSCEKVIDVDLNSASPAIVIEGRLTNNDTCTVKITKSVNFSQSNNFPGISGATVTIADNAGNTVVVNEVSPGFYQTTAMQGISGRTYFLTVKINDNTYTSQSTMPALVNLDSLDAIPTGGFGDGDRLIVPKFTDPIGKGNNYRFLLFKNNKRIDTYFLYDDINTDGKTNNRPLISFGNALKFGDTVTVNMECIDANVFKYFYSLDQSASGNSAAPANPVSNISGEVLGYFSAHTLQIKGKTLRP
jgi:hypothetical protein